MKYYIYAVVLVVLVFSSTGCTNKRGGDAFAPPPPPFLDESVNSPVNLASEFKTAWEAANKPNASKDDRDRMIRAGFNMIDARYYTFREQLYTRRVTSDLTFDMINLSLSFAAAISGGEQAKTVLASLISAVTGTKLAISQDLYNNKATLAVITQMDANRTKARADMEAAMKKGDIADYPVNQAIKDLADYYGAGTVASALTSITESAAEKNKEAEAKLLNVRRKFQRDDSSKALEDFWLKPGGQEVDKAHEKQLKDWMKANHIDADIESFIDSAEFANERKQAVKALIPSANPG